MKLFCVGIWHILRVNKKFRNTKEILALCIVNHLSETYLNFSKTNSFLPHIIVVFIGTCSLVVVSTLRLVVDPIEGIHILLDCVPLRPFHLADEPDHSNSQEEEEKEENGRQGDEDS